MRARKSVVAVGIVLCLVSSCSDGRPPSRAVRAIADEFAIDGYEQSERLEWTSPGARVVLNFVPAAGRRPQDPCADVGQALRSIPGWQDQGSDPASPTCYFRGRVSGHAVNGFWSHDTAAVVLVVSFWG